MNNKTRKNGHCSSWRVHRASALLKSGKLSRSAVKTLRIWRFLCISQVLSLNLYNSNKNPISYRLPSTVISAIIRTIISITTICLRDKASLHEFRLHAVNCAIHEGSQRSQFIYNLFTVDRQIKTEKSTWRSFKTSADILKPQWCSTRLELAQNCTLWEHVRVVREFRARNFSFSLFVIYLKCPKVVTQSTLLRGLRVTIQISEKLDFSLSDRRGFFFSIDLLWWLRSTVWPPAGYSEFC